MNHQIAITALLAALVCACHQAPLPHEEDTVVVGQPVEMSAIVGEVLLETSPGAFAPVKEGQRIAPGQRLLVRKGAWFSMGSTTLGPESHGDRWVRIQ